MPAWDHWYHVTGSTYGTWLRGDPRGWRTRHHREHVEGDYRNPPPPDPSQRLYASSKRLMKRAPVRLCPEARRAACEAMAAALAHHNVEIGAIAVGATHYHIVARFAGDDPRRLVGIAKKRAARALSDRRLAPPGGVWAIRSRAAPIRDASHLCAARRYVLRHERESAATKR